MDARAADNRLKAKLDSNYNSSSSNNNNNNHNGLIVCVCVCVSVCLSVCHPPLAPSVLHDRRLTPRALGT